MFSCKDSVDQLLNYLDGALAADQERHLESHLSECPACVDFLRTYRATPGLCKRALVAKMPEEVSAKLTEFLRTKAPRKPPP